MSERITYEKDKKKRKKKLRKIAMKNGKRRTGSQIPLEPFDMIESDYT